MASELSPRTITKQIKALRAFGWSLPGRYDFNPWAWVQWKEKGHYKSKITMK